MKYFISAYDAIDYRPIIEEQAKLELIKTHFPEAPIEGMLFLRVKDGYSLTIEPDVENNGFNYIFTKEEDV